MGFLKELGELAGVGVGRGLEAFIDFAGIAVGSKPLQEMSKTACDVSIKAGKALGDVAESIADTAISVSKNAIETYSSRQTSMSQTTATQDSQKIKKALDAFDE